MVRPSTQGLRAARPAVLCPETPEVGALRSELLEPHELDLVRQVRVGEPVDSAQRAAHSPVEAAGRHVGVLRLDLQRAAPPITCPRLDGMEQQRSGA